MRFEVSLTEGNFGKEGRNNHIYIRDLLPHLPGDVIGGSTSAFPAPNMMTLEFNGRRCQTDVPTDKRTGKPRPFFRARSFIESFFNHTKAKPGDIVVFELLSPYHLRLSLKR
ncbi:hypothetical protein I7G59_03795 [Sinorhizobium meliloti]|uniref:hypothetical protein n=1 Tax=Rhizobium meliloti TaxID=382 RepID=UPI002380C369|nr:hypothetical protein [Sinorhizobium meliloti]MDE3796453.1 hypothetical protein [Sinorhizobium meliloti]